MSKVSAKELIYNVNILKDFTLLGLLFVISTTCFPQRSPTSPFAFMGLQIQSGHTAAV